MSGALPAAVVKKHSYVNVPRNGFEVGGSPAITLFEAEDTEEGTVLYDDAIAYGFQVLQSIKDLQVANGV